MQVLVNEIVYVSVSSISLVFCPATILSRMSQWFYAVGRGRQVGVYSTWAECQKQVENITNAKFRKFKTHKEAVAFIQECKKKYSPAKSPPGTQFLRDTVNLPTVCVSASTCSQPPSIQTAKPSSSCNMFYSQQVSSSSLEFKTPSQRLNRNSEAHASTSHDLSIEVPETLSPQQLSSIHDLAGGETEPSERNTQICSAAELINGTRIPELNVFFENVSKHLTEIKTTMNKVLVKVNDLENKVEELSCHYVTRNQSSEVNNISGSSVKRSLLESYNVPQAVGNRHFSTTQPNVTIPEVEIVPAPPKKIPKIELNSDDEVDGYAHDFRVNEEGYVIVYTDGACEKNGRSCAKAGIGVWFGDLHPLNCSEPVHGRATNNTAEIQAAVQAVEIAKRAGVKKVLVHTDSEFTINCVTKWMPKWMQNNWKLASGGAVKNKDDLVLLHEAMKDIDVKWEHVRGHQGIHGNEMADSLARSGAEHYKP